MLKLIREYYSNENSINRKVFITVQMLAIVFLLLDCVLSYYFFDDIRALYVTIGMLSVALFCMWNVHYNDRLVASTVIMSIAMNVIYLPILFVLYGRFSSLVPIYFITWIVYTLLLLPIKSGVILSSAETLFFAAFMLLSKNFISSDYEVISYSGRHMILIGTLYVITIAGLCSGAALRFLYKINEEEQITVKSLQDNEINAYVAKDMFLVNLSHEIRTPMNAIVGTVNLLLDEENNNQLREDVFNILNSCNALLSITNELMDLSKSDSGEVKLYEAPFDFNELITEIINMISVKLSDTNIQLQVSINPDIPHYLSGDASKIRQAITILINNSIRHTESGMIEIDVDYSELSDARITLHFDIKDNGKGYTEDEIAGLFDNDDNLNSEDIINNDESNNLGMYLCKEIVNKMDGRIEVLSEEGIGSIFSFGLNVSVNDMEKSAKLSLDKTPSTLVFDRGDSYREYMQRALNQIGLTADFANNINEFEYLADCRDYTHILIDSDHYSECEAVFAKRLNKETIVVLADSGIVSDYPYAAKILTRPVHSIILSDMYNGVSNNHLRERIRRGSFACPNATIMVVDDNGTNLTVASALLNKFEAKVITALSGKECLRLLENHIPDLILMDYMMPEMDGIDTLLCIRKSPYPEYRDIPVIALTANVVNGAREMFLEAGFEEYVPKPISVDKLERILKRLLPKSKIETR